MAERYRWSHPTEWLTEKINGFEAMEFHKLRDFALAMAGTLDGDTIQDTFQSDMDDDGYFEETLAYKAEAFSSRLESAQCVRILESIGIKCYDTEDINDLREAVRVNIADETISIEDAEAAKDGEE